jgi:hypothetical protein
VVVSGLSLLSDDSPVVCEHVLSTGEAAAGLPHADALYKRKMLGYSGELSECKGLGTIGELQEC